MHTWSHAIQLITGLIFMVLIMQHIHVLAGIALFLFAYLVVISKIKVLKSFLITLLGSAVIYLTVVLLRIPM